MIRTVKTKFRASKATINQLFLLNELSAQVYNDCLGISNNYRKAHSGAWIGKKDLQKALKRQYPMHSQSIQAVAHKYLDARDAALKARKLGGRNRYPYKEQKYFNTKWANNGFDLCGNTLSLSLGILDHKRRPPLVVTLDKVPAGKVKEVELVYDRGLKLCLSYDDERTPAKNTHSGVCAVDLGEIHTLAAYADNGESLIVTGRLMRSYHRFRNKKLAELQRLMSRCKKGSRQWKRYNKAKAVLLSKSEAKMKDALHKTTRAFVAWALENRIKTVVVGEVEGVQRHTKGKKHKKVNQKLSNWSFGRINQQLQYKLEAFSIKKEAQNEAYSTQTCPVCGRRKKPNSRNYVCRCGYACHRDIHGARNILSLYRHGDIRWVGDILSTKYLRITA